MATTSATGSLMLTDTILCSFRVPLETLVPREPVDLLDLL